jgi:uncharacterized protein (TIGR01319 family)
MQLHHHDSSTHSHETAHGAETLALLIDFGSTFTKVTAVDLAEPRVIGRAQSPSTIATDVSEGLLSALRGLNAQYALFEQTPRDLESLDGIFVRASSSAAGGLRIVVIGNIPGLTAEAANAAALGAGAKVVGVFAFKLAETAGEKIRGLRPDMILLAGGTDGGDRGVILHNAAMLARARLGVPVIVAGNHDVAQEVGDLLSAAGIDARIVGNVMPRSGVLEPDGAREAIRQLFMSRITDAKGLDRVKSRVPVVLPTPMAVHQAVILASEGARGGGGLGDILVVDVGGATTDVYSAGDGAPRRPGIMVAQGLPEPFTKRTVEGDLGIRWNAPTILDTVGAATFVAQFARLAPELPVTDDMLLGYVEQVGRDTSFVPDQPWQSAADALLAQNAVDIAIERHVGSREAYYSRDGVIYIQSGKDMSEARAVIGTGGVFASNPFAGRILSNAPRRTATREVLRPADPRVELDATYSLYAVGLLAESHPEAAFAILRAHFGEAKAPLECHDPSAHALGLHDHDDCC